MQDCVEVLLALAQTQVRGQDSEGCSALRVTASLSDEWLIETLLKMHSNARVQVDYGNTLLQYALLQYAWDKKLGAPARCAEIMSDARVYILDWENTSLDTHTPKLHVLDSLSSVSVSLILFSTFCAPCCCWCFPGIETGTETGTECREKKNCFKKNTGMHERFLDAPRACGENGEEAGAMYCVFVTVTHVYP